MNGLILVIFSSMCPGMVYVIIIIMKYLAKVTSLYYSNNPPVRAVSPFSSLLCCSLLSCLKVGCQLLLELYLFVVFLRHLWDPLLTDVLSTPQMTVDVEHLTTSTSTGPCESQSRHTLDWWNTMTSCAWGRAVTGHYQNQKHSHDCVNINFVNFKCP